MQLMGDPEYIGLCCEAESKAFMVKSISPPRSTKKHTYTFAGEAQVTVQGIIASVISYLFTSSKQNRQTITS